MRALLMTIVTALGLCAVAEANPRIGDAAPPLELRRLDGATVKLSGRPDQILIVDFFATWCGPCQLALRSLHALLAPLGDRVSLIVVDVAEPPAVVRAFWAGHPLPAHAQVVLDPEGQAGRSWGQDRLPTTFLVDEHGVIRHINRGYGPGYQARIGAWLAAMLKNLPPAPSSPAP